MATLVTTNISEAAETALTEALESHDIKHDVSEDESSIAE
jgi:hypothetical protein